MDDIQFREISPRKWNEVYWEHDDPYGELMNVLLKSVPVEIEIDNEIDIRELKSVIYDRAQAVGFRPKFIKDDTCLYVWCIAVDQSDEHPF